MPGAVPSDGPWAGLWRAGQASVMHCGNIARYCQNMQCNYNAPQLPARCAQAVQGVRQGRATWQLAAQRREAVGCEQLGSPGQLRLP